MFRQVRIEAFTRNAEGIRGAPLLPHTASGERAYQRATVGSIWSAGRVQLTETSHESCTTLGCEEWAAFLLGQASRYGYSASED